MTVILNCTKSFFMGKAEQGYLARWQEGTGEFSCRHFSKECIGENVDYNALQIEVQNFFQEKYPKETVFFFKEKAS